MKGTRMSKRIAASVLAGVMCLALLAGCGGGGAKGNTSAGTGGGVASASIIRLTADSTPILDPHVHSGNSSSIAYCNLYDTLVFPQGETVAPWLAEKWDISEDGLSYTFHLRKGVKFHDGSELKAGDVVFSTNRMITIGEGFAYLYSGLIKNVTADDDYTVTFTLSRVYGPFVSSLCRLYIMSEAMVTANEADGTYGDHGDYGKNWLLTHDAGSGPYMTKELEQNNYFLADRYADWWGGWDDRADAPEQFKIIYGTEPATVRTMMSTQGLEISDMWQTAESLTALDSLPGVDLATYTTRLVQNIFFNCSIAPTDDVNIRKALSSLVDYDTLINACWPGSVKANGPVSNSTAGHIDVGNYTYDVETAKKYIAQSKYADTIGDYELEFLQISDNAALEKVALSMQAACAQAGIKVKISKAPWTTIQERCSTAASMPNMCSINSGPQFNEAGATLESQFLSKNAGTYENCCWINDAKLDEMINDAMSTVDDTARFAKYETIQKYVADEVCASAWICTLAERVAYQSDYVDFPAAKASREGKMDAYLMGYPFYMPDVTIKTK